MKKLILLTLFVSCVCALGQRNVRTQPQPIVSVNTGSSGSGGSATNVVLRGATDGLVTTNGDGDWTITGNVNSGVSNLITDSSISSLRISDDYAVANYCLRTGIDSTASNNLANCITILRRAGIYSNMVDLFLLKSNYNLSTLSANQSFIRSNVPATLTDSSNMRYDSDGLYLPGSSTMVAKWTGIPHTPTNTILMKFRVWDKEVTYTGTPLFAYYCGTYLSSYDSAIYLQLVTAGGVDIMSEQVYSRSNNFGAQHLIHDLNGQIVADGWWRTFTMSHNPSGSFFTDAGINCATNGTTNYIGLMPTTYYEGLTNFVVGFPHATLSVKMQVQYIALFNKVLSYSENKEALRAFRYLDDNDENFLLIGDSRAYHVYANEPAWSGLLPNYQRFKGNWYDLSKVGETISNIVKQVYMTNAVSFRPGDSVRKTTAFLLAGVNGTPTNSALWTEWSSNCWNYYSNITTTLKQANISTKAFIPCLGNGFQTSEVMLNNYIRTNSSMFDEVIEHGSLVSGTEFQNTYWSPDTLHFSTNNARHTADWIGTGYKRTLVKPFTILEPVTVSTGTFFWTNTYGWPVETSIFGGVVTGVAIKTNTVALGVPVYKIIYPGQVIAITNSEAPTMNLEYLNPR